MLKLKKENVQTQTLVILEVHTSSRSLWCNDKVISNYNYHNSEKPRFIIDTEGKDYDHTKTDSGTS